MSDWVSTGNLIIGIILACSVVALAVFLERLWALRPGRVLPPRFEVAVKEVLAKEAWHEAVLLCRGNDSPAARVLIDGLKGNGHSRRSVRERLEDGGRREATALESGVGVVGVVAAVTPLLGLLGTVWGMIDVFKTIQEVGVGNAAGLAGGIGTALYTTFWGLMVAIPAVVGHRVLLARVDAAVLVLEGLALEALELLAPDESPATVESDAEEDASV